MSTVRLVAEPGRSRRRVPSAVAALAALTVVGASALVAGHGAMPVPAPPVAAAVAPAVAPSDLVTATGTWISHGRTLDLRDDGTGTVGVWVGAYDGTLIDLRLVPSRSDDTVAEVTGIRTRGAGGLAPSETPNTGGLVTITVGEEGVARVEWPSGPRRRSSDLCPTTGLDRAAMERLHCGA